MKNSQLSLLAAVTSLFVAPVTVQSLLAAPEPNKYFPQKILESVERANEISIDAGPAPDQYPTIDIQPWMEPNSSSQQEKEFVVRQVLKEATGAGSFNIIGHNISIDLFDTMVSSAKFFFSKSLEEKRQYYNGNNKHGYVAIQEEQVSAIYKTGNSHEQKDLREIYSTVYPPEFHENVRGPAYFQNALDEYIHKLQPVEIALAEIFSSALSMAKGVDLPLTYLQEQNATGLLRSSQYTAMSQEFDHANRLLAHSDFSTLTIIYSTEHGLEEIRDGKWVEVPLEHGQLHVAVGEVYAMWSNELFTNNIHRVSNKAAKDRVSFAYFPAQGRTYESEGIVPVCSVNEVAKFPPRSSGTHVKTYFGALFGESPVNIK